MGLCSSKNSTISEKPTSGTATQAKRQQYSQDLQKLHSQQENHPRQEQLQPTLPKQQSAGSSSSRVETSNNSTLSKNNQSTTKEPPEQQPNGTSAAVPAAAAAAAAAPGTAPATAPPATPAKTTRNGSAATNNNHDAMVGQDPVEAAARSNPQQEIKVLLLGSGESGKSTVVKQMKILHQNGYTAEELYEYKPFVFKNIMDCIKNVINAIIELEPELIKPKEQANDKGDADNVNNVDNKTVDKGDADNVEKEVDVVVGSGGGETTSSSSKHVLDYDALNEVLDYEIPLDGSNDASFDPHIAQEILEIYNTPQVKQFMIHKQGQFYLIDSTDYFLSNLPRIAQPDYIPSTTDVLRTRKKTSGIFDFNFDMGEGLNIHMFDVGGQRSERKKWIHCFDNVTSIIFCVALSEYDQVLLEENNQNRLEESLALFDSVVNSRWFARTSIVLFLNKIDVFAEKLQYSPLEDHFPDYTGGNNINKAAKYILWRFNQVNRSGLNIYPHVTQATDTGNIQLVMAAVKETIMENSLRDTGMLP